MFWISLRATSGNDFSANPRDSALYLEFPDTRVPTPADRVGNRVTWANKVIAAGRQSGNIVFFVHGYDNTVDNVWTRHTLLQQGLANAGFPCTVVSFDWPSNDQTLAYLEDRRNAQLTAHSLVDSGLRLFDRMSSPDCDLNVHIVAHSMGTYLVEEAFENADHTETLGGKNWSINQIAFLAADVSSRSLSDGASDSESLYRHIYRLTNYFSGWDEALEVSNVKRFGTSPRAGRVGLPQDAPARALDVDCSNHFADKKEALQRVVPGSVSFTHSWYFYDNDVFSDLALTLAGKIDRNVFPTREPVAANDFRLR